MQLNQIALDLQALRFERPMKGVQEDGGAHRPNQIDVLVHHQAGCSPCSECGSRCSCSAPRKSLYSVRPRAWLERTNSSPSIPKYEYGLVMSRFDDHNPFFQISLLFNAWSVSKAQTTHPDALIVLGEKVTQSVDNLWTALFKLPVQYSEDLPARFELSTAWFLTSEYGSPLTKQLDDMRPS
jgi:hypothetical protein